MNIQKHGGQDNNIKIDFKEDFSVTTNYMGSSNMGINGIKNSLSEIEHYPPQSFEPYVTNLKNFLYNEFPKNNNIILGNGASELIDLAIKNIKGNSWKPGKSNVQFLEYERSSINMGKKKKKWDNKDCNLTCIINPNNPTGDYMNIEELKCYIEKNCQNDNMSHVIVDESMQIWHGPNWREDSLISQTEWIKKIQEKNIYVYIIHSWTKIFTCTGLRYGSIICPTKEIYNKIKTSQVPWSVNILALKYIDESIKDKKYLEDTWNNTKILRKKQVEKINTMFPQWKCKGEDFLSWIWIDTFNEDIAELAYTLAKYNGTPIRHGKMGYKMNTHIRIAVRDEKYFDDLLECLKPIKNLNNKFVKTPVHVDINPAIIDGFKWVDSELLLSHEEYIEERHLKLLEYVRSIDSACSLPAIIVCSKTFTIIDGHHRYSVMRTLGIKKVPCLLVNYENENIIVNPYKEISKNKVLETAKNKSYLEPKSTCHMVIDNKNSFHPIQVISPIVFINTKETNN